MRVTDIQETLTGRLIVDGRCVRADLEEEMDRACDGEGFVVFRSFDDPAPVYARVFASGDVMFLDALHA